jgi:putrescine aminotransferase
MNLSDKEKKRFRASALKHVIPHFANNAELAKGAKIFTRGEGCYVWDIDGNKYFDSFATLLTTVCGHNRPEVTEAVRKQMETL